MDVVWELELRAVDEDSAGFRLDVLVGSVCGICTCCGYAAWSFRWLSCYWMTYSTENNGLGMLTCGGIGGNVVSVVIFSGGE